jgi:ubiquinone/menaquinone biosynthesis C-methylase UbiE
MPDNPDEVFSGSIPQLYERYLVPLIFRPYAEDIAGRVTQLEPSTVLEIAAGTGVVTRELAKRLPADVQIIATDLNEPMLIQAASTATARPVEWRQADAMQLPFGDEMFDVVVCQFGSMFFPDKVHGHSQARRVLREGGHYLLAIWDAIERNDLSDAAQQALIRFFPDNPPLFMREGPFGYHDPAAIERDLRNAGFKTIEIETVELRSRSPSARDAASALCYGTPMGVEVDERRPGSLKRVFEAVERALRPFETAHGIDARMSAHIVTASE